MLRIFLILATTIVFFMNAHWTQRFENADLITSSPCIGVIRGEPVETGGCKYSGVTVEGRLFLRSYEVIDPTTGTAFELQKKELAAMAWAGDQNVFTWRTTLLSVLFVLILAFLALGNILEAMLKSRRSRGAGAS